LYTVKRNIEFTVFILIISFCFGCDPLYDVKICNNSKQDVIIEIEFDKQSLERHWNGRSYLSYLDSYPSGDYWEKPLYKDTVKLIYGYVLGEQKKFDLESGIGYRPDFDIISRIKIIKTDTISFEKDQELLSKFSKVNVRSWVLNIE